MCNSVRFIALLSIILIPCFITGCRKNGYHIDIEGKELQDLLSPEIFSPLSITEDKRDFLSSPLLDYPLIEETDAGLRKFHRFVNEFGLVEVEYYGKRNDPLSGVTITITIGEGNRFGFDLLSDWVMDRVIGMEKNSNQPITDPIHLRHPQDDFYLVVDWAWRKSPDGNLSPEIGKIYLYLWLHD